jgi:type II restriction enzyme
MTKIISDNAIATRKYWVGEIQNLSGNFADDTERLENELKDEIFKPGASTLIDHLRLCGNIPEAYSHDSSEEKLYSKYTDSLLCFAYKEMGLKSVVLTERADVADVDAFAKKYSFVADAKAFRLSRTAKNQKDFKVQAMDGWKHGKPYAMVVCPIYQLPTRSSQIYQQASTRNVCIFTYSHLSLLVNYALEEGKGNSEGLLLEIFKTIPALNPSKNAVDYWLAINKTILSYSKIIEDLWKTEKEAATESTDIAKEEGLTFLASEREKIMRMSHEVALKELMKISKIESKIKIIQSISDSDLFGIK